MVRKGKEKTMSQHTPRRWAICGGRLEGGAEGAKGGNPQQKSRTRGEKKGIG